MARTILNGAILAIRGRVGGYVYRLQPDGTITVSQKSLPKPGRKLSPSQLAQVERFKQAMALYRALFREPATRAAYERIFVARGSRGRLHALVVGDIMLPPLVRTLDLSSYHGFPGDTIRITAEDNLAVARLSLVIRDLTTDCDVETGEYSQAFQRLAPVVEWHYQARLVVLAGHIAEVCVTAFDLAGNRHVATQTLKT